LAASNRFGVAEQACFFDGINDYILIPHAATLNVTGAVSISVWVKPLNQSGSRMITGKSD
jgi:hypothetical protein